MFSKHVGIKDSNEAEISAILEAFCIYCLSFQLSLIVESDSIYAVSWARTLIGPWKMQFYFNEISVLSLGCCFSFQHVSRSPNAMADSLAK